MGLGWHIPVLGPAFFALWCADARRKRDWIVPWLEPGSKLLEVGSGPGSTVKILTEVGYDVTGLDIVDGSFPGMTPPDLYDGGAFPYPDNAFDAALLLTMLHHCPEHSTLLTEARRVARRVLVVEDIYSGPATRRLTKVADSITNLEFFGHPHSNRDDAGWRSLFDEMGFSLVHQSEKPYAGLFRQALYVLE